MNGLKIGAMAIGLAAGTVIALKDGARVEPTQAGRGAIGIRLT